MTYRAKATFCAAIFFPAAMLASLVAGALLKSINPSNIDITQGLAYLGHLMLAGAVVGLMFIVTSIVYMVKAHKHEGANAIRLPLAILITNIVIIVLIFAVNAYTLKVRDQYLIDHGRPTLDQYFDAVKQQKK